MSNSPNISKEQTSNETTSEPIRPRRGTGGTISRHEERIRQRDKFQKEYTAKKIDPEIIGVREEIPVIRKNIRLAFVLVLIIALAIVALKIYHNIEYYFVASIHTNGVIEVKTIPVNSSASGILKTVIKEGTPIEEQQVAATLNDTLYQLNIDEAEQKLKIIEGKNSLDIQSAKEKFEHDQKLAGLGLLAQPNLAKSEAEFKLAVENAKLARVQAQTEVEQARLTIAETLMRSPQSGIVNEVIKQPGEAIKANDTVMIITNPTEKWVTASIPEHKIQYLRLGQRAKITPLLGLSKEFWGTVERVYMSPRKDSSGRDLVQAKIKLDKEYPDLQPRTVVTLDIESN